MVGKLIWILLEVCRSLQQRINFTNRLRIDKVIATDMLAQFFTHSVESQIYGSKETRQQGGIS